MNTTTTAPSNTTATPSPTVVPTDPGTCWTCPAGQVHYWTVPGKTSDDKCACITAPATTATPVVTVTTVPTTTKSSNAVKIVATTLVVAALALTL
jgi:hypothetical protein